MTLDDLSTTDLFPPTRTTALERLSRFVPRAGADYAKLRNYDLGPSEHRHVSGLSPYLRCRLLTEEEVLRAVLGRHSQRAAEKFVQEVFWRTYWKGWLELRPSLWSGYRAELRRSLDAVQTQSGLRAGWDEACSGKTGIACFDHWAQELVQTGYLHNHARMWFASIWIFTLRLPWALGADFFLRHLLDGDPASNTLSWRWVAGLQTRGKTYLARADNIAKYTEGRFDPANQLAESAPPLDAPLPPDPRPAPVGEQWERGLRTGLLLTAEDLSPAFLFADGLAPATSLWIDTTERISPLRPADHVRAFAKNAVQDVSTRWAGRIGDWAGMVQDPAAVATWAREAGLEQIVTAYAPMGPTAMALSQVQTLLPDVPVIRVLRRYDRSAWPHATHGFFQFRKAIPSLVEQLAIRPQT